MNIKKLFATLAGVSLFAQTVVPSAGVFGATYSQELEDAYNWAYSKSITTKSTIDDANMYGAITRAEMAKMLANWAKDRGETPDTSKACTFTDTASVGGDLGVAVVEACQLGLMGQGISAFRPYDTITRAEFGTALSRALWGTQYEGGNPYYANHLNALKAAGIMNQIANAESTKEIRGYVMLMLMRSDAGEDNGADCDDPVVKAACLLESDACPAECKENNSDEDNTSDNTNVKSGDLEVSAKAATDRKIIASGTSDLDTLIFKTSEEVEITKITLERYGYSSDSDNVITGIWLEDEDGNTIADEKTLSKDKVTLNIKKDYRKVDGEFRATVVLATSGASGTIGFKVIDAESTAKNLNLDNYSPYTYEVVDYKAAQVTVTMKGSVKNYNYEEGKSYEVAKFKLKSEGNAVLVKGFTLKNLSGLDMQKYLDKVTVTADSTEINATATANRDDELVISLSRDYEIDINKSATFAVNVTFTDFDDYGEGVQYYFENSSKVNVLEAKNGTRTTITGAVATDGKAQAVLHIFEGGKIRLSNTKLGSVDAAQGSEGNVVAEGNITITEPLSKIGFTVTATGAGAQYIDHFTMIVDGDEYESKKPTEKAGTGFEFEFSNISIEKSGKIQFEIDIKDPAGAISGDIKFVSSSFGSTAIANGTAKYDNSNKVIKAGDIAGSISFATNVKIQAAKGSLENSITKKVEYIQNETSRKTIFDGTYKAKKVDIDLNKFYVTTDSTGSAASPKNKVTFYLFIDGEEVADTDTLSTEDSIKEESFSDVRVRADQSVKVRLEAEVEAYGSTGDLATYRLWIEGTDMNGNEDTGRGDDATVATSIKVSGGTKIDAGTESKTVLLKASNQTIAKFTVKPSNSSDDDITLDTLSFSIASGSNNSVEKPLNTSDVRVKIDGTEYEPDADGEFTYSPNEKIPSGGLVVDVVLKKEQSGTFELSGIVMNDTSSTRVFSKRFVDALVVVTSQENKGDYTKFTVEVDEADDDITVSNLVFWANSGSTCTGNSVDELTANCHKLGDGLTEVEDGKTFDIDNIKDTTQSVTAISYSVTGSSVAETGVVILKKDFEDFFKVGSETLRVFSNK